MKTVHRKQGPEKSHAAAADAGKTEVHSHISPERVKQLVEEIRVPPLKAIKEKH